MTNHLSFGGMSTFSSLFGFIKPFFRIHKVKSHLNIFSRGPESFLFTYEYLALEQIFIVLNLSYCVH